MRRGDGEFRELIQSISCEPFTFEVVGRCVTVVFPTRMFTGTDVAIRSQQLFGPDKTDDEVILGCLELATTLLVHELQEHFQVDGETWRDPHRDGNVFNFTTNARTLSAPVTVAAPASVTVPAPIVTGWPSTGTPHAFWPASDPRRHRPRPMTAIETAILNAQRDERASQLAAQLARLESMREL